MPTIVPKVVAKLYIIYQTANRNTHKSPIGVFSHEENAISLTREAHKSENITKFAFCIHFYDYIIKITNYE